MVDRAANSGLIAGHPAGQGNPPPQTDPVHLDNFVVLDIMPVGLIQCCIIEKLV